MDISLDKNAGQFRIRSYQDGAISVNQQTFNEPILLSLNQLVTDQLPNQISALTPELLKKIAIQDYEVVILGTGKTLIFPDWELIEQAQVMGSPLEVMATDAACRTFTVLASEGRNILAILYP